MPLSLNFPQLDFVKPSSGFHPVTWERVIEGVLSSLTRSTNLNFLYFGSMTNQGMFEMHMSLIIGKKLSMHKTIQSHPN